MFTNLNLWTASRGLPIQTLPCGPGEEACLIFNGLCIGCCLVHSNLKSLALKKSPGASLFDVVLVTFLDAAAYNSKEGFIVTHSWKVQPITVGKAWQQEFETAEHITSAVGDADRDMQLASSLIPSRTPPPSMALPTLGLMNPTWKCPRRNAPRFISR